MMSWRRGSRDVAYGSAVGCGHAVPAWGGGGAGWGGRRVAGDFGDGVAAGADGGRDGDARGEPVGRGPRPAAGGDAGGDAERAAGGAFRPFRGGGEPSQLGRAHV